MVNLFIDVVKKKQLVFSPPQIIDVKSKQASEREREYHKHTKWINDTAFAYQ